jgi:hypothetical protein
MVSNELNAVEPYDLSQLPSGETDEFGFKSSLIKHKDQLKNDLCRAVSAFANSGGGTFIAGVDGEGAPDGGLSLDIGKADLRDWVDKVVRNVAPTPNYEVRFGVASDGRGRIDGDKKVLVVVVKESTIGPHMAHDNKYYIRAGTHTEPARHFIVEAIWAKRYLSKPRIAHVVRPSPQDSEILQLGIVALTGAPAVDLRVGLSHMPMTGKILHEFPLHVEVIDQQNPMFFDISTRECVRRSPKEHELELSVTYHDLASNEYEYKRTVNLERSVSSLRFFHEPIDLKSIERSLELIANSMTGFRSNLALPQIP